MMKTLCQQSRHLKEIRTRDLGMNVSESLKELCGGSQRHISMEVIVKILVFIHDVCEIQVRLTEPVSEQVPFPTEPVHGGTY